MDIFIILPTQLFKNIKDLKKYDKIYLIEEPYYLDPVFHKQKLVLHIGSLTYYYDYLSKVYKNVEYIKFNKISKLNQILSNKNDIYMYDPIDSKMKTKYKSAVFLETPLFLNTTVELEEYKNKCTNSKNYNNTSFYKWQRKKYDILMNGDKPAYDSWSFDKNNRKPFNKEYNEIKIKTYSNKYLNYAKKYVESNYPNSFGKVDNFYYPITHKESETHINNFIKYKIDNFGVYQDAISNNVIYGNHANISALMNIGLLTPKLVIDKIIEYYNSSKNKKQLIDSVEAIIRQIISWREYMHFIYLFHKNDIIVENTNNYRLTNDWYTGNTELEILNTIILKVQEYAYLHHIERLMIVNNLAILYNISYNDIYKWFMRCFIDSYDWVMVPNIQMNTSSLNTNIRYMTRVYLASDNYIKKMSNYRNKDDFKIINDLYWKYLRKNKNKLKRDYNIAAQLKNI